MTLPSTSPRRDTRPENTLHIDALDGLRGLAIFLVVLFHVWQISWFDYTAALRSPVNIDFVPAMGFFGLDLFFFLSAFCLTLPYARHRFADGPAPTLGHFFRRRIAKIVPSYWLVLVVFLFVLPDPYIPRDRLWFHLLTHVLFIHNGWLETVYSITGVLWSLAVEAQFYVLFPLVMRCFRRQPLLTVVGLAGMAAAWRLGCLHAYAVNHDATLLTWRDNQLPSYLDVFAAGIAAASLSVKLGHDPKNRRWRPLFAALGVLTLAAFAAQMQRCYSATASASISAWTMNNRLLLSCTLLLIGLSWTLAPRPFQRLLANPVLRFLSVVSYNLYLWHVAVARLLLTHHWPPTWATDDPHLDPAWMYQFNLLAWAAAVAVAAAVTFFWERPFLRGTWPRLRQSRRLRCEARSEA